MENNRRGAATGDKSDVWQGTLTLMVLKFEQEGFVHSKWGVSDNNRSAKFYDLTKAGQRKLKRATAEWRQTQYIVARFLEPVND